MTSKYSGLRGADKGAPTLLWMMFVTILKIMLGLVFIVTILPIVLVGRLLPPLHNPTDYFLGKVVRNFVQSS